MLGAALGVLCASLVCIFATDGPDAIITEGRWAEAGEEQLLQEGASLQHSDGIKLEFLCVITANPVQAFLKTPLLLRIRHRLIANKSRRRCITDILCAWKLSHNPRHRQYSVEFCVHLLTPELIHLGRSR